jgi:hypothetical protein
MSFECRILTIFTDNFESFPLTSPPDPAPGQALLDDDDLNQISNFFDSVNTDAFDDNFFNSATNGMDNLGYGWNEMPPQFMGSSTSYGHQPAPSGTVPGMIFPDQNNANGNMGLLTQNNLSTTSETDISNAAALLLTGHNHGNIAHHIPHGMALFDQSRPAHIPPPPPPTRQPTHPSLSRQNSALQSSYSSQPVRKNSSLHLERPVNWQGDSFYTDMVFGSNGNHRPRTAAKPVDIQYGSDVGFAAGSFVAPVHNQAEAAAAGQNMMAVLSNIGRDGSSTAPSTRPSSPVVSRHGILNNDMRHNAADEEREVDWEEDRPTKRRKSSKMTFKDEDGSDEETSRISRTPKKRRPKSISIARPTSSSATQSPPPSDGKRRKSTASKDLARSKAEAAKANRENLTEDQKRQNHIMSEQKRRTLIKEGFDDLNGLVPELKGGGHSKSAVLELAAAWLEGLIKDTETLRQNVRAVERDTKGF